MSITKSSFEEEETEPSFFYKCNKKKEIKRGALFVWVIFLRKSKGKRPMCFLKKRQQRTVSIWDLDITKNYCRHLSSRKSEIRTFSFEMKWNLFQLEILKKVTNEGNDLCFQMCGSFNDVSDFLNLFYLSKWVELSILYLIYYLQWIESLLFFF